MEKLRTNRPASDDVTTPHVFLDTYAAGSRVFLRSLGSERLWNRIDRIRRPWCVHPDTLSLRDTRAATAGIALEEAPAGEGCYAAGSSTAVNATGEIAPLRTDDRRTRCVPARAGIYFFPPQISALRVPA
jgi:hypothetical protein